MVAIIIVAIILYKAQSAIFYGTLIWFFVCVINIVINLTIFDIKISDEVVFLKRMLSHKSLNLHALKINNITIRRHPLFFMETSEGNFNINYTRQNYQQLLELLKRNNPNIIELFILSVRRYILSPDNP